MKTTKCASFGLQTWMLLTLLLCFMGTVLSAQVVPIRFGLDNVESMTPGPPYASPWVFDGDDPAFITHDGNPFTYSNDFLYNYHYYAYKFFYSTDDPGIPAMDPTSSWCIEENLGYVDGVAGFRIEFQSYVLTGFQHANLINPGAPWSVAGQAGDIRTYTGGVGLIYHDKGDGNGEQLVLRVTDCVLRVKVHYPNTAAMQLIVPWWSTDIGSGQPTTVEGWGTVDVLNSDPNWAATFANPAVGNRIDFIMDSVDPVIQGNYGYYDFNLGLQSAPNAIDQANVIIPIDPFVPILIDLPQLDLQMQFNDAVGGGPLEELNDLSVFNTQDVPVGNFPGAILSVLPRFWQFNTTLGSFSTDITFDLTGMNFGNPANWQILRKSDLENDWLPWGDITVIDANHIRANNVTAFSEWTIGSTEDVTLPVELSSFTAIASAQGFVSLAWTTQSESNVHGYQIYRNSSESLSEAILVSNLIEGTNTSSVQHYTFTDAEVETANTYYYWLQQLDLSGAEHFYGPIMVTLTGEPGDPEIPVPVLVTGINSIFPNPGSEVTLDYALAKDSNISVSVYNLRGQMVKRLFAGFKNQGSYFLQWDGKDANGNSCPSGVYFFELNSGNGDKQRAKLLLIK
jgi:hypothetical protein